MSHLELNSLGGTMHPSKIGFYLNEIHIFRLKTSGSQITSLLWDHTGVRLLVATQDGEVEVYGMLDNLLNRWHRLFYSQFAGEPIVSSLWLSVPRKVI